MRFTRLKEYVKSVCEENTMGSADSSDVVVLWVRWVRCDEILCRSVAAGGILRHSQRDCQVQSVH